MDAQIPASAAIVAAFNEGRKFRAQYRVSRGPRNPISASGVREIQQAFLPGAALVDSGQNTKWRRADCQVQSPHEQSAPGVAVKFWPWSRPEVRHSYTDQVVSQILSSASAASDGGALAALETSAKWWGLGLASATVTPSSAALAWVTPSDTRRRIGRALCRDGQSLLTIDVRGGRVTLTPCAQWTIQGDADPASWMYLCTLNGPSRSTIDHTPRRFSPSHPLCASPFRPWAGRSPCRECAMDTARAAGLLEHGHSEEN